MSGYKELNEVPPPPPAYSPTPRPPPPQGYAGYPQYPATYAGNPGYAIQPGYAPAPPVLQQQSSNTNVVVVGQPTSPPPPTVVRARSHAQDYLVFTLVLFFLCLIHLNFLAVLLLVPAVICSCFASTHNSAGHYESAKQCGEFALCCNILVIVKYVLLVIAAVVVVVLFLTGVLAFASDCFPQCTTNIYGTTTCRTVCQ